MSDARSEIENLMFLYAERMDAGDIEGVIDLLADADVSGEGSDEVRRGRNQLLEMYGASPGAGGQMRDRGPAHRTKHVTTNVIIEVDDAPGTATARSYFTALRAPTEPGGPIAVFVAGRYHDRFVRAADGAWRFAARHYLPDFWGEGMVPPA